MSILNKKRSSLRLLATAIAALSFAIPSVSMAQSTQSLRIGYQKYGTLSVLKGRGTLEKRLASRGIEVKWTEFPAGPVLLEGLNVGSLDFGSVGEAPPIFAQAAGANLVYVANEPPAPLSEGILVPKGSTIKSVAELKGKKIALNKGSNVHYLLLKALEKAGLAYTDVETIFLPPSDARAAFERGSVDAWVIWDPFFAAAEKQIGARILIDGKGLVSNHQFFLATRAYAEKNPDLVKILIDELDKVDQWSQHNLKQVAAILSAQTGLEPAIVELAAQRYTYGVTPISSAVIDEQQKIADAFATLKLIPKKISVKSALLVK